MLPNVLFGLALIVSSLFIQPLSATFQDSTDDPAGQSEINTGNNRCHTPGLAEHYVLALSWQPAFCEQHRDKPECRVTDPDAWQTTHFTLHGLWPNQPDCGTRYSFCGSVKQSQHDFCKYPPVPFRDAGTLSKLGQYMPAAAYGSCLQRHEWFKHGTCQTTRNADEYFNTAMRLQQDFNNRIAPFMAQNIAKTMTTESFFALVDQAFGSDAHRRLKISCSSGNLVSVYINLPTRLDQNDMGSLIQQADPDFYNGCGARFRVDAIGQ
ncbi:ribonuclease T2 family protein [Endozoicomonas sp.]|uniref:ribonuclease T2 family protein n=1 Tax=Endozoicomonas sp. TaxID=1892382 RepID=UPI002885762F|nr:hypothetical protein [Endozoicomonas sp.]